MINNKYITKFHELYHCRAEKINSCFMICVKEFMNYSCHRLKCI